MNKKICVVSCFLIVKFCFPSTLQISDSGRYISKDIFFKIAEYIVPNLLTPTHPKEIAYQDAELKSYRLVCKKWRDLLDQRVDFELMNRLFVKTNGWRYKKFFNYYKERLDVLKNSYIEENKWFIEQYDSMDKNSEKNNEANNRVNEVFDLNHNEKVLIELPLTSKIYRKHMKKELALYHYDGLLMLEKYLFYKGFVNTDSLIRFIYYLYVHIKNDPNDVKKFDLLKKLTVSSDLTGLFSRLLKKLILHNQNPCIDVLKDVCKINYKSFLYNMYVSFSERLTNYSYAMVLCSNNSQLPILNFFNFYAQLFLNRDFHNKYFLYYLLLYSKNSFFNIQLILLIDFIRGIEKKFADYPESDRIEYVNLFKKNFLGRNEQMSCGDSVFLKNYFGIPFV